MNVVLDANALVMPFQYRINIDIELKRLLGDVDIYVPECVIGELKKLLERRREGKMALQLANKYRTVKTSGRGDKGVLEAAKKLNAYVVTNDKEFIKQLIKEGIRVIYMKQNHLVMRDD